MPADLDALQGAWNITALEMEGQTVPGEAIAGARIEVDGDRFATTGMGAAYGGTLTLDDAAKPRRIDMHFDVGPEIGNVNRGIYELSGNAWKVCIATRGSVRPDQFASQPGSGFAFETLERAEAKKNLEEPKTNAVSRSLDPGLANPVTEFEGEWRMVSGVMNGAAIDESSVQWVKRVNRGDVTTVLAGPQTMLKAQFTFDSSQSPATIDYLNLAGAQKGKRQHGIYAFDGGLLKICVAAPGGERPAEFHSTKGDGRTFTVWKKA